MGLYNNHYHYWHTYFKLRKVKCKESGIFYLKNLQLICSICDRIIYNRTYVDCSHEIESEGYSDGWKEYYNNNWIYQDVKLFNDRKT